MPVNNCALKEIFSNFCSYQILTLRFFFKGKLFKELSSKWPRKQKNVALEKFLEENTLKPCDFWAGEALETQMRDCLNITLAQLLLKKIEKKSQMAKVWIL